MLAQTEPKADAAKARAGCASSSCACRSRPRHRLGYGTRLSARPQRTAPRRSPRRDKPLFAHPITHTRTTIDHETFAAEGRRARTARQGSQALFAKGDEHLTAEDLNGHRGQERRHQVTGRGDHPPEGDRRDRRGQRRPPGGTLRRGHHRPARRRRGRAAGGSRPHKAFEMPARFKGTNPRHFRSRLRHPRRRPAEKAYRFGQFLLATIGKNEKSAKWCNDHGLPIVKAASENINEAGGFLVPEELDSDLIQLREMFGVVRQEFKRVVMKSDTKRRPRRTGGLKAYHLADGDGITASHEGLGLGQPDGGEDRHPRPVRQRAGRRRHHRRGRRPRLRDRLGVLAPGGRGRPARRRHQRLRRLRRRHHQAAVACGAPAAARG